MPCDRRLNLTFLFQPFSFLFGQLRVGQSLWYGHGLLWRGRLRYGVVRNRSTTGYPTPQYRLVPMLSYFSNSIVTYYLLWLDLSVSNHSTYIPRLHYLTHNFNHINYNCFLLPQVCVGSQRLRRRLPNGRS